MISSVSPSGLDSDHLSYKEMDSKEESFHTASKVTFVDLLHNLSKKIRSPDLQFSHSEVAKVINDLEAERVIYDLVWHQ